MVVARPTRWGNPFKVGMYRDYTAQDAVDDYRKYVERDLSVASFVNVYFGMPPSKEEIQRELRGKNLACWCALDQPCHADVLLELANK